MADEKITEQNEEEFIILDKPPEDPITPPEPSNDDEPDHEDDDEQEDARLAVSDDDHDADIAASKNAARRKERRERQRRAREAQEQELQYLRHTVGQLSQRVSAQEGYAVQSVEQQLVQQYHATMQEAQQAEHIMAKAMEAQNGEDHTAALRIRDAAMARAQDLRARYDNLQRQKAQPQAGADDAVITQNRNEWLSANNWFDPGGSDPDSAAVRAIDARMQQEGLNPATRGYWQELTRRASEHFNPTQQQGENDDDPPLRKAPPQGGRREHVPPSTRREIYVTPERKQAMQDAGVWDDPKKRNQMLKAYAEYDRQASER